MVRKVLVDRKIPFVEVQTKPLSMGRKSMFKYGLPSAANSLWPQIKWTLQCQRALV